MLEATPTGTRENGPYDLWDICQREILSENIQLEYNQEGKHLAPNGEISKLPEFYAKIVRTPTFLKWFGDWTKEDKTNVSKVVYETTGEPMLVFHGTKADISGEQGLIPQPNPVFVQLDNKLYFSDNIQGTGTYSGINAENNYTQGHFYSVFLCIKNPLDPEKRPDKPFKDYWKLDSPEDGYIISGPPGKTRYVVADSKKIMHLLSSIEVRPK